MEIGLGSGSTLKHDDVVIPFGNSRGKTFRQVSLDEIDRIVGWMEEQGMQDDPGCFRMTGMVKRDFYQAAVEYLSENHYGED